MDADTAAAVMDPSDADESDPFALADPDALVESWQISLRAAKKSPATIKTYRKNVGLYFAWCRDIGIAPSVGHSTVTEYLAELCDEHAGATGRAHLVAIRSLARWLAKEKETPSYDLGDMERPKIDEQVTEPFTADELASILKACAGRRLMDLRDTAIVRILLDCGGRAKEIVGIELEHVKLADGVALVHGKGGKERFIPLSDTTCEALDRYLRARRKHPLADRPQLWLGQRDNTFGYNALWKTLKTRARAAGVANAHPHRFRHTFADRWLDKGGSEGGLMRVAGWSDPAMVQRYSKARAARRALAEARRLNVGEL